MKTELTVKIAGEAGQGMNTIGSVLTKMSRDAGFHIFANLDYMSRIRGGSNFFQLRISEGQVFTLRQRSDIVIALDKQSFLAHKDNITDNAVVIIDNDELKIEEKGNNLFHIPFYRFANEAGGSGLYINSAACGAITGILRFEFGHLEKVLKSVFSKKGNDVIEKNIRAARLGYDHVMSYFKEDRFSLKASGSRQEMLLNGNEAIALGAIAAGCKFYSAYPMTPSTSIMNVIAHYARDFGIVVEQAEDEIAAVNMVIGASFAGARSMTATSGGGFALMAEGLSLAGMTETPLVVVDAQRPAPATGFPTRTEQADLEFILHAGHGEFARAVYSPGTIEECFYLTMKAFNLAEKYQAPVLIMTDQYLADSYRNICMLDGSKVAVERHVISKEDSAKISGYRRYALTENGISPRAIPSWISEVVYADSDEHNESGHITEDAKMRVEMVRKRYHKKMEGLFREVEPPSCENLENAAIVLVGFGSTYGVMKEASRLNKSVGFIHFSQVWPLPNQALSSLPLNNKKIVTVENNATAQLARLLKRETDIKVSASLLRFDGRPMDIDFLIAEIERSA